MKKEITKKQDREVLKYYLVKKAKEKADSLEIEEGYPEYCVPYSAWNVTPREDCYSVCVPSDIGHVGSSHHILISKITGEIISDDWFGE